MSLPSASLATNMYLYGFSDTPDLAGEDIIRRKDLPEKIIPVELAEYMDHGGGRFALGSLFQIVQAFFSGAYDDLQPGDSRSKLDYADLLGFTPESFYGINLYQRELDDNIGDFAERTYVWNSLSYKLGDVVFKVNSDGTRVIENFSVVPRSDDEFDFSSDDAGIYNRITKAWIDPWGLGQNVILKFSEASGSITPRIYTEDEYNQDTDASNGWSFVTQNQLLELAREICTGGISGISA